MSTAIAAAAVAWIALGASLMATALLVLFNPRSTAVRWYAAFVALQLVWLALQGLLVLNALPVAWRLVYHYDVHFMPALFTAAALAQMRGRTDALTFVPIAVALLVLPLLGWLPLSSPLTPLWHGIGWGVPAIIYARQRRRSLTPGGRALNLALALMVPIGVLGAILLGGVFLAFLLPLMILLIQFLLFLGVVYHRYYDIEVRASRTGELAASAAERDRLALLGELSATIAHEVRNPLTGIRSLAQRLAEEPLEQEKRSRYVEVILGEIGRLDRIVANLGDVARRNGAPERGGRTELQPLLEDLGLLVESRARRAGVRFASVAGVAEAPAAREPLAQALLNLLINAIEHSPPGSTVEIGALRGDRRVSVYVRDQGPGIPVADRERVFDAFHTGRGGSGLGLAVVRRVAEEQGWTIELTDATGGGAEFRIHIPDGAA